MSQLEKIRNSFLQKGYREKDLISQQQFFDLLNSLRGGQFDEEVAMEIWEQVQQNLNSHNEATVHELISIIQDAQNILREKLYEVEQTIQTLEKEKREIQQGNMNSQQRLAELQRVNYDIEQTKKDRQEYQQDLQLVSQPFGIDIKSFQDSHRPTGLPKVNHQHRSQQNTQLQHVFYAVLIMTAIEVVVIYKKYDFLNLLVLVTAMSIFTLNFFDSTYLKLSSAITGVSIVADFIWLIMYAGSYWSPSLLSEHNLSDSGYLKFIILLTIINIAVKVYLAYLIVNIIFSGVENDISIHPFEGVTLDIKAYNDNLVTKTCKGGAGGYL